MTLQFKFGKSNIGEKMRTNATRNQRVMSLALNAAAKDASNRIVTAGKADMLSGGNFGSARWQNSIGTALVPPDGGAAMRFVLSIFHRVPFAFIFEYGGIIKGKPLLWIPLPWNPQKVRARDFRGGKLFRVERKGKNPLLMVKTGKTASAMYVGVKQVKQKRRFRLRPIIRRVAKTMPAIYRRMVRLAKKGA